MKNFKLIFYFILAFSLVSCEKFLSVAPPNDKLETTTVFSDSASASLAIVGIYSRFSDAGFLSSQVRWAGLSADELAYSGSSIEIEQIGHANIIPDNPNINSIWSATYEHIYQINNAIEGIESSNGISQRAKLSMFAELKFLRAFLYFYAVNNWGDIPLILATDYRLNESLPRAEAELINKQISDDLMFAMDNMSADYLTGERVRPNQLAAKALSARFSLYLQDWATAATLATEVINTNAYMPLDMPEEVFLKESKETIWQLYPSPLITSRWTYDGYYFVPSSFTNAVIPTYLISGELFESFETGDNRRTNWIGTKTIDGHPYFFPHKYKVRSASSSEPPGEYTKMLRLAEQILIRAEANAHLGNLAQSIADLNVIRQRAGLGNLPFDLTKENVLLAVEIERRHELFCELGHRWFDLKRTGKATKVLSPIKKENWQPTDVLWPIPMNQLLTNPNLNQNAGY